LAPDFVDAGFADVFLEADFLAVDTFGRTSEQDGSWSHTPAFSIVFAE
jgi:hypothetical protein